MKGLTILLGLLALQCATSNQTQNRDMCHSDKNFRDLTQWGAPLVYVVILVRNKELNLPYFLSYFEKLEYPKQRMILHLRADNCEDKSIQILEDWLSHSRSLYRHVDAVLDKFPTFKDDNGNVKKGYGDMSLLYNHVMRLREEALNSAKKINVDFTLFLDADVYLTNPITLQRMVQANFSLSAPMLNSLDTYSNFWGDMSDSFWYQRSDNYMSILDREVKGCFEAKLINSFILINMASSSTDMLTFEHSKLGMPEIPKNDLITFAISASKTKIEKFVCNNVFYGYVEPVSLARDTLETLAVNHKYLKMKMLRKIHSLTVSKTLSKHLQHKPNRTKSGFDKIYYINLQRRKDKKKYMEKVLAELNYDAVRKVGVDGRRITQSQLKKKKIKMLPGYKDPYTGRDMSNGEIGCFLSHYRIWEEVVRKGYEKVMVLEDDVFIRKNFQATLDKVMKDIEEEQLEWDYIYLGRKNLHSGMPEVEVPGVSNLYNVSYSHWTISYLLSGSGAQKLLDGKPLKNLMTLDEYIPLMYGNNPKASWAAHKFPTIKLKAFVVVPEIIEPRYYTSDLYFISDSEEIDKSLPFAGIVS